MALAVHMVQLPPHVLGHVTVPVRLSTREGDAHALVLFSAVA